MRVLLQEIKNASEKVTVDPRPRYGKGDKSATLWGNSVSS